MNNFSLKKDAIEKVEMGQTFAEYDLIRNDPELFVSTPSTISALNINSGSCFFIERRGAGKTAIVYELQRKFKNSIQIAPKLFWFVATSSQRGRI